MSKEKKNECVSEELRIKTVLGFSAWHANPENQEESLLWKMYIRSVSLCPKSQKCHMVETEMLRPEHSLTHGAMAAATTAGPCFALF